MEQVIWLAVLGAVIALDHAMLGQFMLSQPIVTGALFGLVLNDWQSGLLIGTMLQLLWVGSLPVGAFIPSDYTITGGITACLGLLLMDKIDLPISQATVLALMAAIPAGYLSGKLDIVVRQLNCRWNDIVNREIDRRPAIWLTTAAWSGLVLAAVRNFIIYVIWLTAGAWLLIIIGRHLPELMVKGLAIGYWLLPALSLAVIIDMIVKERRLWWTLGVVGLTSGLVLVWPLPSIYLMILIMGAGVLITLGRKIW